MHRDVFKTVAVFVFCAYHAAWIFFWIVAVAEILGRKAVSPGPLFCVLVPAVLVVLYVLFLAFSQLSVPSRQSTDASSRLDRACIRYPRYMWDIWSFHLVTILILGFIIATGVSYCIQFAFDARPDLDMITDQVAHFLFAHLLLFSGALIATANGASAFYAYTMGCYDLVTLSEIQLWTTAKRPDIRLLI